MSEKSAAPPELEILGGMNASLLFERALEEPRPRRGPRMLTAIGLLAVLALFFALIRPPVQVADTMPTPSSRTTDTLPISEAPPDRRLVVSDIQAAAAAGGIDARIELGLLHLQGNGVPRDRGAAVHLFTEAAQAGSARADSFLWTWLNIQPLDHKRVHDYWLPLAEAGDARIISALGELYMRGRGVAQDGHKAVHWFERAIQSGFLPAHVHLVKMYAGGRGIPPDPVKKIHHLRLGAEAGRWDAVSDLAAHLLAGRDIERNPTEAFALAIRAAQEGDPESRLLVGTLYAEGLGVERSLPDAAYWLRIASDDGETKADIMLESLIKTGRLPDQSDLPKNFADHLKEAQNGRATACYQVGIFLTRGQGTRRNETEGVKWIHRAATLGHPRAQWEMAEIFSAGRYVPQDPAGAARWREIAESTRAMLPHIPANDSETRFLSQADQPLL